MQDLLEELHLVEVLGEQVRGAVDEQEDAHDAEAPAQLLVARPPGGDGEEDQEVDGRQNGRWRDAAGGQQQRDQELAHEVYERLCVLEETLSHLFDIRHQQWCTE